MMQMNSCPDFGRVLLFRISLSRPDRRPLAARLSSPRLACGGGLAPQDEHHAG